MMNEKMYTEKRIVTPALAEMYLAQSKGNRPIRRRVVERYANDMTNGKWVENYEPIHFDTEGTLINGHHRLSAIIKSGVSVPMLIIRNVPLGVSLFDKGATRSTSDYLSYKFEFTKPELCSPTLVGVVRFLYTYFNNKTPSDLDIEEFVINHEDSLGELSSLTKKHPAVGNLAPVYAAMFMALLGGVSLKTIERFQTVVATGFYEPGETGAVVLRNSLMSEFNHSFGGETNRRRIFIMTQEALHDFIFGVKRTKKYPGKKEMFGRLFVKAEDSNCFQEWRSYIDE